jgi:hypothetical protein
MPQGRGFRDTWPGRDEAGEPRLVAYQQKPRIGVTLCRSLKPVEDGLGRVIAAHRVHRQRKRGC